jgi:hypothetical protein
LLTNLIKTGVFKMENKNLKIYGLIGKSLCGCAGGIVGFVLGGPLLAVPGVAVGVLSGHVFEKSLVNISN